MNSTDQKFIYFEKQGADMLCGQHCINSLLQGPYFDEISLGTIAQGLDQQERELLGGSNFSPQGLPKGGGTFNVANDGNFSIQVLNQALKNHGDYQSLPILSKEVKQTLHDYSKEEGFICHSVDHWIAIRKVHGVWYNLNSTNMFPPGPQTISDFYLAVFIDSLQNNMGYTVFVIRGPKPLPMPNKYQFQDQLNHHYQFYVPVHQIEKFEKDNKNRKLNMSGQDERELEEALKRSLQDQKMGNNGDDDDESAPMVGTVLNKKGGGAAQKEEKKFQAFKGQGVSLGGPSNDAQMIEQSDALMYADFGDDPELAYALKLSMMEEEAKKMVVPDEPNDTADLSQVTTIQLRFPDGQKLIRKFFYSNKIGDIINYVKKEKNNFAANVKLSTTFPKKFFDDHGKTLKECGISKSEALNVDLK